MTKAKKLMSLLLGLLMLFTVPLIGCKDEATTDNGGKTPGGEVVTPGDDDDNKKPVQVPKADDNVFLIGSWVTFYDYNVKSHDEQMKIITDAGVNFTEFPASYDDYEAVDTYEDWKEIDRLCTKYKMFYNLGSGYSNINIDRFIRDIDISTQLFEEGGGEYMIGYHVWDEPFYDKLEAAADWFSKYYDEDPIHPGFINLNGSSGVPGVDMYSYANKWATLNEGKLKFIGYDLYPFAKHTTHDLVKFQNMDVLRKVAIEHGGLRTHAFAQSTGWGTHRMPTFEEICWDTWGFVTYGFKSFSYFNYVNPSMVKGGDNPEGFNKSLIMADGTIPDQQLFDKVADNNWRIRAVGDVLMNYDATDVYHIKGGYTGMKVLPEDYFITTNASKMVLSYFEPKDGTSPKHIMLFNNSWTDGKEAEFNVDTSSGLSKLEWFNPDTKKYENIDISSGKFTVDFAAGEGKLYRIRGNVQG